MATTATRPPSEQPARSEPPSRAVALLLAAQGLCLAGLCGLVEVPAHAEDRLGVAPGTVTALLAGAAVAAALAFLAAGIVVAQARRRRALLIAVLALGAGLLATTVGISAPGLGTALVPVAVSAGFAARLSAGELAALLPRARATVLQLATAAAAVAIGVPLALLAGDGNARTAFALGGGLALCAALPLLRLEGTASPALVRAIGVRAAIYAAATGVLLGLALVIHGTPLLDADTAALEQLHGVGSTSGVIESLFVSPSLRNYVIILALVALVGARLWGRTTPLRTLLILMGAGCVAYVGVRTCWALWERPRPEEVLDAAPATGRSWAPYPSFPSGHMAVTMVLALMTATLVPKLRFVLWAYAAIIAFTRLSYGAHFPSDVLLGAVLGWLAYRTTIVPLRTGASLRDDARRVLLPRRAARQAGP